MCVLQAINADWDQVDQPIAVTVLMQQFCSIGSNPVSSPTTAYLSLSTALLPSRYRPAVAPLTIVNW